MKVRVGRSTTSAMANNFQSQFEVRSPESCKHDSMDLDVLSRSPRADSLDIARQEYRDAYVPVNYISPEAYAFLAAAEASAARRADALDAGVVLLDVTHRLPTLGSELCGWRNPQAGGDNCLSSIVPPKKFYRTFWKSVSLKLLHRAEVSRSAESVSMLMVF